MVESQNFHLKKNNDQILDDIIKSLPALQETINKQRNFFDSLRNDKRHQVSKFLTDKIMKSSLINKIAKEISTDQVDQNDESKELQLLMAKNKSKRHLREKSIEEKDMAPHPKELWSKINISDNKKRLARNKRCN